MTPITEDELADFVAWLERTINAVCDWRGAKRETRKRRIELLEELRQRAFAKKPIQMEIFPDG